MTKGIPPSKNTVSRVIALIAIVCAMFGQSFGQTTPADTQIQNQASATYSDGSGGSYSTVSNTVTVTVAKVSGLAITPDGASDPNVVPGQTGVLFNFVVANTGNFSDQVKFLSGGASVTSSGLGVITRAVIDVDNSGGINVGDVAIFGNGADVLSASTSQGASFNVIVEVSVNGGATAGQTVQVVLGDAAIGGPSFDNQAANSSANEVRTESAGSVNGLREARGDRSVTVANDAILQLSLTATSGPVPLGSVIAYNWGLCNIGSQPASSVTLTNGPVGSNSGVFIIAPIPAGTELDATQSFPVGVGVLYSTSPLSDNPLTTAAWTTAVPAPLSSVTRVAFNVGNSLPIGIPCAPVIDMNVLITTTDVTNPISEQGVAYGTNSLAVQISDLSELRLTTLQANGSVLNGPQGQPGAVGPTDTNDDYTNKSVNTGIAGIPAGGVTDAAGSVSFTNTVQNTGDANDTFTLTVTAFPAGATVTVTVGGVPVVVVNNGVATGNPVSPLAVAFGGSANYQVDVTLPLGKLVLTGYDTVIRATSANTVTATNDTIDRVYTGFVRLDKTASVSNPTGVGAPDDSVPGAAITFAITYTNVSSSGGTNNVTLTATNIVITENGAALPNNWATYTDHVVGASDTLGGIITGDALLSTVLTDTIASLSAGQSGVFSFNRRIK